MAALSGTAQSQATKAHDSGPRPGASAGGPIDNLTPGERKLFNDGQAIFAKTDTVAGNGLGPRMDLIDEFLSPLSNRRADEYGGTFDGRIRFALEVATAVRGAWPDSLPLFMRISAVDWVEDGWQIEDSVELARRLQPLGVDLIDCSSGGIVPYAKVQIGPAYQTPFAERIRRETGILTGAVGMITEPDQADGIIRGGQADMVLLAREFLRDPYWPLHAANALGAAGAIPKQYGRAF